MKLGEPPRDKKHQPPSRPVGVPGPGGTGSPAAQRRGARPDVSRITREQYTELLLLFARYAEITFVETGTISVVHASTLAALDRADHLVTAAAAEPPALQITTERVAELVNLGYGRLVSRSTVVATVTDPARPEGYAQGVDFFAAAAGTFRSFPTTGRPAPSRWNRLRPATELAYARGRPHHAESDPGD